ncbi:hypothetical protein [Clostridium haemolyticum]|uniref:Uncharacterized protein n=1 Tax=Clostridium haemolyticum NCTC 9693 TaxID=1443114 RepID=A0ABR4TGP7_CLOHA|nr:hypothetical protein [Clostridium haemolyticum]KEI14132.1 hypothetical protein Z960_p0139 [Clostridium haemolyticum NCTC 9693]KEI18194.1 hypothetical protein Z960_03405 [Clostridium haemolyticum NCTC 9693]KGN04161.1 hypothetical protein Z961_04205 [Clostridium haemolyticum NCTC 8350]
MKQYIEGNYLITEYDSGAVVKVLHGDEPKEVIPELPKNPILELEKENEKLKQELKQCQQSIIELTALASTVAVAKK